MSRLRMGVNHPQPFGRSAAGLYAPVLVTDGETRTALACVRSLGARGVPVHVLATRTPCLAGASRFAAAVHVLPDAAQDAGGWAREVVALAAHLPGALLLPVTEVAMGSAFAHDLARHLPVAAPPREAYDVAVDKHALLARAGACGLDVPRSTLVEAPCALRGLPDGHRFPVVLKARRSRWIEGGRWRHGAAAVVRSDEELRAAASTPGFEGGLLVQEFVPGHGEGVFLLADHGATRVCFAHRRLREKPPSGGVSVLSESIPPDPALAAGSERLLAALGWHGVAMVEFRRAPDGRAVVMEVNPRLWGSLQLAIDAGVDFPALAVALARGEPLPAVTPRAGVRTRWLLGELDHLWIAWREPAQRAAVGRSRAGLLAAFLRGFFDGSREEVLRWSDPRPFWVELRRWLS